MSVSNHVVLFETSFGYSKIKCWKISLIFSSNSSLVSAVSDGFIFTFLHYVVNDVTCSLMSLELSLLSFSLIDEFAKRCLPLSLSVDVCCKCTIMIIKVLSCHLHALLFLPFRVLIMSFLGIMSGICSDLVNLVLACGDMQYANTITMNKAYTIMNR